MAARNAADGRKIPEPHRAAAEKLAKLHAMVTADGGVVALAETHSVISQGEEPTLERYGWLSEVSNELCSNTSEIVKKHGLKNGLILTEIEAQIEKQKGMLADAICGARGIKTTEELTAKARDAAAEVRRKTTAAISAKKIAEMKQVRDEIIVIAETLVCQHVLEEFRLGRVEARITDKIEAESVWILDRLKAQNASLIAAIKNVGYCAFELIYAITAQEAAAGGVTADGANGGVKQYEDRINSKYRAARLKEIQKAEEGRKHTMEQRG